MKAKLLLNNGMIFEGESVGAKGTSYGALCFNTAMNGYQEILTDPSYAEQIVVMTYPEIGNYGINEFNKENNKTYAKGLIMKNYCFAENHYLADDTLSNYLKANNIVAINGTDTRELTKTIIKQGYINSLITTEDITDEMKNKLKNWQMPKDVIKQISTKEKKHYAGTSHKIALIDLGVKNSILNSLLNNNTDITVFYYNVKADEILKNNFDGVILSNGVGNPENLTETIQTTKELFGHLPILGICTGYQVLALALGYKLDKLPYPRRGGNHPVINTKTQKVFLTVQNTDYTISEQSIDDNTQVIYRNLNADTIAGFTNKKYNIDAIQFHPEDSDDEVDASVFFKNWLDKTEGQKLCQKN